MVPWQQCRGLRTRPARHEHGGRRLESVGRYSACRRTSSTLIDVQSGGCPYAAPDELARTGRRTEVGPPAKREPEKTWSIRPDHVAKPIRIICQLMPTVATRCHSIQSAILHATCTKGCSCWSAVVRNRPRILVDVEEVAGSIPAAPTT